MEVVLCVMLNKRGKGSVGRGEAGKRAKTTPDAGGNVREICESEVGGRAHLQEPLEKSESK